MIALIGLRKRFCWYKPTTYLPYLIRKIAKIDWNHVGLINTETPDIIYEAIGKGVVKSDYLNVLDEHDEMAFFRLEKELDIKVQLARINRSISSKYDFKGLLWHQLILNIFKKWVGKEVQDDKFYCYEFAAYVFHRESAWRVVPKEFIKDFILVAQEETSVDKYNLVIKYLNEKEGR